MKKIVFFDIDGTLLDETDKIVPSAKESLKKLRQNGILTAVATGRSPFGFKHFREKQDMSDFDLIIYGNGCKIEYQGKSILDDYIDDDEVASIVTRAKELGITYGVANDDVWMFSDKNHPDVGAIYGASLNDIEDKYDPDFYLKGNIVAGCLFCDIEMAVHFQDCLKTCEIAQGMGIGGDISLQLDFWRKDVNKATAILKAIDLLGIDVKNTYAFGDGSNDIDMLKTVNTGIAMGNAIDDLKKVADYVTDDILNDGVKKGLEYYGLI